MRTEKIFICTEKPNQKITQKDKELIQGFINRSQMRDEITFLIPQRKTVCNIYKK